MINDESNSVPMIGQARAYVGPIKHLESNETVDITRAGDF